MNNEMPGVECVRHRGPSRFRRSSLFALFALFAFLSGLPGSGAIAATYLQQPEPYAWIDASAHTRVTWAFSQCTGGGAAADDDITAEIPLGFTFMFGTVNYTTARIMTNGRVQFGNNFCGYGTQVQSPRTYPYPYPHASLSRTMRVYGADLIDNGPSRISYASTGAAPNRRFVVTWDRTPEWGANGSRFDLQLVIEEAGNFVYQFGASNNTSGGKAQIGWQLTTADWELVSFANIGALAGTAVRFYKPGTAPNPGGFNAFDSTTGVGAISGSIQTRVAGLPFSLDLVALNATRTGLLTNFAGSVTLELVDSSNDSGALDPMTGCRSSWTLLQAVPGTLSFTPANLGRITVPAITVASARRNLRARVQWVPPSGPAVVGCSSDNFSVRPASFSVPVASDADWQSAGTTRVLDNTAASGGVVHAAGRPFSLSFSARDAGGATLSGYDGTPVLSFTGCALPSPCAGASALSLSAPLTVSGGIASTATATYAEAGAFTAFAQDTTFTAVDAGDGTPLAQRTIQSAAATIGRFVPERWVLAVATAPEFAPGQGTACTGAASSNFTWLGQPLQWRTAPVLTATAQGAAGNTMQQASGALFKLAPAALALSWNSNAPAGAAFSATGQTVTVSAGAAPGTGTIAFGAGAVFGFARPLAPVAPFNAVVALTVQVADASEAAVAGNGTIASVPNLVVDGGGAGIAFEGGNAAGANLQTYGRLQLSSAHGDSRRELIVPYETQAWSGTAWYRNQRDSCLQPPPNVLAMSNWGGGLAACNVSVTSIGRVTRGQGLIRLSAPVAAAIGGLDLTMRLAAPAGQTCIAGATQAAASAGLAWLLGPWTSAPDYSSDPGARATFGRHRVSNLIRRELF
ncbi:MAG: hypothetical protein KJZ83_20185 [Burkholderiaceae bacterium]|nr:hypothetical protein [Burkholderiaceae bacterium]